jgi:hypothetical protein
LTIWHIQGRFCYTDIGKSPETLSPRKFVGEPILCFRGHLSGARTHAHPLPHHFHNALIHSAFKSRVWQRVSVFGSGLFLPLHKINFFEYLTDVLNRCAEMPNGAPTEAFRELLPDRWTKKEQGE